MKYVVVTQLFSYMIGKGIRFGTAVAQVFAFILQALHTKPPPSSWHDATTALAIEYDDVLRNIPETVRKGKEARLSPYKP
ncbi:unnamed protein product [Colletotrichum noveboracense]|uniref:Uncharacterized protein n=1 Tax=Colletotrichum noveboracense TaxID=2664923 RepID=A0A9W4WH57_9PEZI|nr:unnamed protein product [Colletotrichum noveboracense]